jgi:hypothetical protein
MQDIIGLAVEVSRVTEEKIDVIDMVTRRTHMLSMNARLEAARAGERGAAFAVVAQEMAALATEVNQLSTELRSAIRANIAGIEAAGETMMLDFRGARYADLARNVVEIIDRNLYERSCDVRWWATDSAVVAAATDPAPAAIATACSRLATILRSYTVYLDLWVADGNGRVIASGRGNRYPGVIDRDVSQDMWFRNAMRTATGDDFTVCDIDRNDALGNAAVATYATAIRADGATNGPAIGALGIFFDWEPQAGAIVRNVALSEAERQNARVMILNAANRVIATSDGGLLGERFDLRTNQQEHGYYRDGDKLVSFSLTPGYETYAGLGWHGCIESWV